MVEVFRLCLFVVVLFLANTSASISSRPPPLVSLSQHFLRVPGIFGILSTVYRVGSLISLCLFLSAPLLAQNSAPSAASQFLPSRAPVTFGQKIDIDGIANAGKISDTLYRGAQPHAEGFSSLKALGITTIVDLRQENPNKVEWERQQAEALGIRFIHIPVSGWDAPTDAQISRFLGLFQEEPQQKTFVHCRFGEDRTGVFIAAYRISQQNWSAERAIREMYLFGFNARFHPIMKSYIHSFPEHLNSTPALANYRVQNAHP
jgi:tyrosine-protein phosphatase SIW14